MKCVLLIAFFGFALCSMAGEALILSDFQDARDREKWESGDSGEIELSVAPRAVTDANAGLKAVFKGGAYPGFSLKSVPRDWTPYEVLAFEVWSDAAYPLHIRIDDSKSSDYKSRFNKTVKLEPGHNLCQIKVEEIDRVLEAKDIKRLILFTAKPPAGLSLWFDNFTLGKLQAQQVKFIPYADRLDLQPTLEVETPHLRFGRNLAGGPLSAFLITGIRGGREVPELMQRVDLKPSVLTWDRAWDQNTWGMGDFYGKRGHAFDRVLMQKYFASSMQGPEKFEAMLLCTPVGWREFPPGAREALLKRVKEDGEGLVLVHPFPGEEQWPADLLELSALIQGESDYIDPNTGYVRQAKDGRVKGQAWKAAGEHPIARGVPLEALPFDRLSYQKYELAPGAEAVLVSAGGDPVLAVRTVGKGRVVTCAWHGDQLAPDVAVGQDEGEVRPYRYWEVMYSLLARAALWAGQREFQRDGEPKPLNQPVHLDPNLQAFLWHDGAGKVTDWELRFTPPWADGIVRLDLKAPGHLARGEQIAVEFSAAQETLNGAEWKLVLAERAPNTWRTLEATVPKQKEAGVFSASFATDKVRQSLAVVRAEARKDGKLVAQGEAEVVVTPPGESWDDYETFMWPVDGLPYLRKYEDVLMREAGSSGVMDTGWQNRGRLMRWARAGLRVLPHNVDVRPLHIRPYQFAAIVKQYRETKDKKHLIRDPSYADPAFLEQTRGKMRKAAEHLKPFHIPAYVLCDEPSLTSYREEFDFDFHPQNIANFRKKLETKFKTVANLNAALGTQAESFAKLEPPVTEEARAGGNWGLWNEWRAHNDDTMAEGYRLYRETLRHVDPQARISVSGTQTANPFDGFDWAKLSPLFDSMCGYGYGEQERKRLSFYDGQMKNATPAGYGNKGKGVNYQVWNQLVNHGCGHVLFWWVSFRNPDLSFCASAKDYRMAFAEMRSGIGRQYQLGRRHTSPVAIQYSMNSMRAAWATGRFDAYTSAVQGVTDALVAQGLDPVFVSDAQIAAGELKEKGLRAVFLPLPLSMARGVKEGGFDLDGALLKFAEGGGLVVTTHDPEFDEFLQKAAPDPKLMEKAKVFEQLEDTLGETLGGAGIHPWVKVTRAADGQLVPGLSIAVHRLNGNLPAYLVTLLRKPVGQKEVIGADGVLTYVPDPQAGNEIEKCRIELRALGLDHASDVRAGRKLEIQAGAIAHAMPAGDGFSIALLPYAIKGVKLDAKVAERILKVSWQLERDAGPEIFAPHAVRIEVSENGEPDAALSHNATSSEKGAGELEIPLALEDAGRKLKVTLRDVLTGVKTEAEVSAP